MITVKELQLNVLPSFTEVVAGEDGLGREVTWVVVGRSRTPAFETLKGGELALVSLRSLRLLDEELDVARLFSYLDEMGVAAVAILGNVPPEAISVADDLSLPVLSLPEGTSLNELNSLISRYIAENRQQLQQWNQEVYRQFTELAIEGKGIAAIAERLCQLTNKAVVVEDANFRVRTRFTPGLLETASGRSRTGAGVLSGGVTRFSNSNSLVAAISTNGKNPILASNVLTNKATLSEGLAHNGETVSDSEMPASLLRDHVTALRDWLHNKELRSSDPPLHLFEAGGGLHQLAAPIIVQAEVSGYVSLLGRDFTMSHRVALGRAAAALAIERAREIAVSAVEDRLQANVIDEVLDGTFVSPEMVLERAKRLGYDLNLPYYVAAFSFRPEDSRSRKKLLPIVVGGQTLEIDPPITDGMARELQRLAEQEAERRQIITITRVRDDRFMLLFSNGKELSSIEAKKLTKIFLNRFALHFNDFSVTGGLGRYYQNVEGLPKMATEAEKAVTMGLRLFGPGQLTFFGDLGVYRLLLTLGNAKELREFYNEILGRLIEHDNKNGGELLQTLECYFKCHGSPTDMAKMMHLHRNTLLYRLHRIEEITGIVLDPKTDPKETEGDPLKQAEKEAEAATASEARLALHLALRIGEVLGERR